jgi:mannose-1-phosphate guanylyltransferase
MKVIIFAGGTGTRFWPLSRKNFPKQFIKMFNGKSTIQLMFDRVSKPFGVENISISTNEKYKNLVKDQLPDIKAKNIVTEPDKRNLAPAVGYNLVRLKKQGYSGPVAILWADHLMDKPENFIDVLKRAEKIVKKNPQQIAFVGEKPRFANNNLGWIHVGEELDKGVRKFVEWHYKPPMEKCQKIFESGEWYWNPGYFVLDLDNALELYKKHLPKMLKELNKIKKSLGTKDEKKTVNKIYPTLEKISFDSGIIEKVSPDDAYVMMADLGWSDPGTLYALKEVLTKSAEENYTEGNTVEKGVRDSLIINEEPKKLIATIGLNGMIVVNTKDAIIVVPKEKVVETTDLINLMSENPEWVKYI